MKAKEDCVSAALQKKAPFSGVNASGKIAYQNCGNSHNNADLIWLI